MILVQNNATWCGKTFSQYLPGGNEIVWLERNFKNLATVRRLLGYIFSQSLKKKLVFVKVSKRLDTLTALSYAFLNKQCFKNLGKN